MHSKFYTKVLGGLTLLGLMFFPVASAHTGDMATGSLSGLLHPFSGADHLLMIIRRIASNKWMAKKGKC